LITPTDIESALQQAEPLFSKIQNLYGHLPDTRCECETPGQCCVFIPEMTWLEALQWIAEIRRRPRIERAALVRKFVEFYLTNPVRSASCPFLVDGGCGVYPQRTFACRAYGIWSRKSGRRKTEENRAAKRKLLEAWKQFGVELAPDAIISEMDYCARVEVCAAKRPSDPKIFAILEKVYRLDSALAESGKCFEGVYHSDFSFLMAALVLGSRKAVLGKFGVIKEIVQKGTDTRLRKFLDKITPENLPV
jgi:Fe-S-cluster containining protein